MKKRQKVKKPRNLPVWKTPCQNPCSTWETHSFSMLWITLVSYFSHWLKTEKWRIRNPPVLFLQYSWLAFIISVAPASHPSNFGEMNSSLHPNVCFLDSCREKNNGWRLGKCHFQSSLIALTKKEDVSIHFKDFVNRGGQNDTHYHPGMGPELVTNFGKEKRGPHTLIFFISLMDGVWGGKMRPERQSEKKSGVEIFGRPCNLVVLIEIKTVSGSTCSRERK